MSSNDNGASGISQEEFDAAFEDYVASHPLPEDESEAECHNCGEPWNGGDEWDVRHINTPDTIGESWHYECPNCERETFEVGI